MSEQPDAENIPSEKPLTPRQQITADLENVRSQRSQFAQQLATAQAGFEQCTGAIAAYERTLALLPEDPPTEE